MIFRSGWKDNMDSNIFVDSYPYLLILNLVLRQDDICLVKTKFLYGFISKRLYIRVLIYIEILGCSFAFKIYYFTIKYSIRTNIFNRSYSI